MSASDSEYDRWVRPMEARLKRAAWRIVHDAEEVRDVLQAGLEKVWRQWEKVRAHPDPQALIFTIVVHVAYDHMRKRGRRAGWEVADIEPERHASREPGADQRVWDGQVREAIHAAIGELPEKQRIAVTQRLLGESSYESIAAALGCSEVTVRTHYMRALQSLRTKLAPLRGGAREEVKL